MSWYLDMTEKDTVNLGYVTVTTGFRRAWDGAYRNNLATSASRAETSPGTAAVLYSNTFEAVQKRELLRRPSTII